MNQASQGARNTISVHNWVAIPFTTDTTFTEFRAVELTAVTLFPPGLFFAEIWSVDTFAQPDAVVQVLSGPAAPAGLSTYSANVSLAPNTSYFLVIGTRNGGSQTWLFTQDNNQADTAPPAIYQLGTDIDGNGTADLFNRCLGTVGGSLNVNWQCAGPIARVFFPKFRILAEQPAPPANFSLTASPLALDFGSVSLGVTSAPLGAVIMNDGNVPQAIGTLSTSNRFALSSDACSGSTLGVGASCNVALTFTPDHGGFTSGTLVVPAPNDPSTPYGMPLVGQVDSYNVGGALSGLAAGAAVTLQNNGGDDLSLTADGAFNFVAPVDDGAPFSVTVAQHPVGQTCNVLNGAGSVNGAAVTTVVVNCLDDQYALGGLLTGLVPGDRVVIQNNGGDDLTLTQDGAFLFGSPLPYNAPFSVSVLSQPGAPSETCVVSNGSGTMPAQDVSSVGLTCTLNTFAIGGSVSGLAMGASLELLNKGADALTLTSNGAFAFNTPLADGTTYAATIARQPAAQTCTLSNDSGTVAGAAISSINVSCIDNQYTVGGLLSGLLPGDTVTLQNNGGDSLVLAANGPFTFSSSAVSGDPYSVSVLAQPSAPSETCQVTNGWGSLTNSDITNVAVSCSVDSFRIGGALTGLSNGQSMVLQNNGGNDLTLTGDGSFTFSAPLADGSNYSVSIVTQPAGQTCTVNNGSGVLSGADITAVAVSCVDINYTLGGQVSGLASGDSLVLQNNGGDNLTITTNGSFSFPATLTNGNSFSVSVLTQPPAPSETCAVSNGTGVIAAANYDRVGIACTLNVFSVGGTLSGLAAGESVTVTNNGTDSTQLTSNGGFAFPTQLADGSTYSAAVATQPAGQTCSIANGNGTLGGAAVGSVTVNCTAGGPPPGSNQPRAIPVSSFTQLLLLTLLIAAIGTRAAARRGNHSD